MLHWGCLGRMLGWHSLEGSWGVLCWSHLWEMVRAAVGQEPRARWGSLGRPARVLPPSSQGKRRDFQQFPAHLADAAGLVNGVPSCIV